MPRTAIAMPTTAQLPPDAWIPAVRVLLEVKALTGQEPPIGKRRLLDLAASARVPLILKGREWGCHGRDIPAVAEALGLRAPTPAPVARRAQKAPADHAVAA